ncbi:hypothetical protein BC940DRAFT_329144 [Gongronella butleri]|nr:hypothetical protein BC940DRAFT_329144 [Gongronella butleri]
MLHATAKAVEGPICRFRVGETKLKVGGKPMYLADGVLQVEESGLEVLVLEVSGALGTHDASPSTFDHIKGACGAHAMIKRILRKHPNADPIHLTTTSDLFLHASAITGNAKSLNNIRLWELRPTSNGRVMLMEHLLGSTICTRRDANEMVNMLDFFWAIKHHVERVIGSIASLRDSHDVRTDNRSSITFRPIARKIKIEPIKLKEMANGQT